jgi:hypothetical protein
MARTTPAHRLAERAAKLPVLRRLPAAKLLILAEVILVAREHFDKLDPSDRQRLLALLRVGRGRQRNLHPREREELRTLVAKAEPRLFLVTVANKLSPVSLPKALLRAIGGQRAA